MVAIPYRFDPGHRHHENRFLYQEPVLFISVLILFCLCFITKSIGDDLGLKATSDELKRPSESSEPAERKTNRLKRKDLRSACVSKSQVIQFQKGYAVIVARHNDDMDLCGTVCRCSNRLRASSTHQYCALTKS